MADMIFASTVATGSNGGGGGGSSNHHDVDTTSDNKPQWKRTRMPVKPKEMKEISEAEKANAGWESDRNVTWGLTQRNRWIEYAHISRYWPPDKAEKGRRTLKLNINGCLNREFQQIIEETRMAIFNRAPDGNMYALGFLKQVYAHWALGVDVDWAQPANSGPGTRPNASVSKGLPVVPRRPANIEAARELMKAKKQRVVSSSIPGTSAASSPVIIAPSSDLLSKEETPTAPASPIASTAELPLNSSLVVWMETPLPSSMSANVAAGTDKRIQQSSTGGDNPETKARRDEGEIFVLRGEVKNIQEDLDKKEARIRDLEAQLEKSEARIRELEAALVQVRHTASNVLCM